MDSGTGARHEMNKFTSEFWLYGVCVGGGGGGGAQVDCLA